MYSCKYVLQGLIEQKRTTVAKGSDDDDLTLGEGHDDSTISCTIVTLGKSETYKETIKDFLYSYSYGKPETVQVRVLFVTLGKSETYRLGCKSRNMVGSANPRLSFSPNHMGFFAS